MNTTIAGDYNPKVKPNPKRQEKYAKTNISCTTLGSGTGMMSSIRKTFLAFILAFGAKSSFGSSSSSSSHRDAVLCPLDNYYIDDADQPVREYYECPGKSYIIWSTL